MKAQFQELWASIKGWANENPVTAILAATVVLLLFIAWAR